MGHLALRGGDTAGRSGCHTDPPITEQLALDVATVEPTPHAPTLDGPNVPDGEAVVVGLESYVSSRSWSTTTERQRRSLLGRFVEVVGDAATCDADDVMRWWATTAHLAPASRRAALIAARGYVDWLVSAGVRSDNPLSLIRTPTVPKAPPKVLTPLQVTALRRAVTTVDQHLLIELQLTCGLRISECNLDVADLDPDGWLRVRGKGGKVAMVPVPDWLAEQWPTDRTGPLFGVTTWSLRERVLRIMERAGIEGHGPHSLRRTCGTELARKGVPLHVVAGLLRHDSVQTTTMSYTAVSLEDLRRAVE